MELSFGEIILVCLIAFLVLGPEDFVRRSRQFGLWVGRLRTHAQNFRVMAEEELTKKSGLADTNKALNEEIEALRASVHAQKKSPGVEDLNG